ncbi:MAG: DUF924 family protein [Paracoccaceae bacterium]
MIDDQFRSAADDRPRLSSDHQDQSQATAGPPTSGVRSQSASLASAEAQRVVAFWTAAGPAMWFAKDPAFDRAFRDAFLDLHIAAAGGKLTGWLATAEGALALVILLDQFPRNAFRDTPRMYASDPLARAVADDAIASGHDQRADPMLRLFFYLPFAHSEDMHDQERSVALGRDMPPPVPDHSRRHQDIVRRFGRFPHRNVVLGRQTTPEEAAYLAAGGYGG